MADGGGGERAPGARRGREVEGASGVDDCRECVTVCDGDTV